MIDKGDMFKVPQYSTRRQARGCEKYPQPPVAGYFPAWLVTFKINPPIFSKLGGASNVDLKKWTKKKKKKIHRNRMQNNIGFS